MNSFYTILLLTLFLTLNSCNEKKQGVNGNNNDNNTIVQGDNNTIDKSTNIVNNNLKVTDLYPEIIIDYFGKSKNKIKTDFGDPEYEGESEGYIGPGFSSEIHNSLFYDFKNGTITFYYNIATNQTEVVYLYIKNNYMNIPIPPLHKTGENYPSIVLGKTKFKDLFSLEPPKETVNNIGSTPESVYTEALFYFGKFGNYHTFTFGKTGLVNEEVEENYKTIENEIPDYIIIE